MLNTRQKPIINSIKATAKPIIIPSMKGEPIQKSIHSSQFHGKYFFSELNRSSLDILPAISESECSGKESTITF